MQILQGEKLKGVIDPISQLQKYLEESIALDIELQALGAQEAHLRKILDNYSNHLKKLPDKELALVRLMRDKEVNNKIYTKLLEEREQARIREAAEIGNIRVIEPAEKPRGPTRPKKMLNLIIGVFTGIVIGLTLIFVREFLQEAPRTQEQVERLLRLPVLTLVPQIKPGLSFKLNGRHRQQMLIDQDGAAPFIQDAYSYLWSSLQFSNRRRPLLIMITSTGPSEGKSTIASNLALTAARHGKKTILIDGDLRKPTLHETFGVACSPGLRNLVIEANEVWPSLALPAETLTPGEQETSSALALRPAERFQSFHEAIFPALEHALQVTEMKNLRILTMGDPLLAPDVLWTSSVTEEILSMLRQIADFVIIDTPPVIGMPDASIIARYCDGVLFCVAAGQTDKTMQLRAKKILEQASNKLWGVVLNKVDLNVIYGASNYSKYYAKYYGKGERHRQRSHRDNHEPKNDKGANSLKRLEKNSDTGKPLQFE
jgi:tyrosine-protein kinase Etk/Wzc